MGRRERSRGGEDQASGSLDVPLDSRSTVSGYLNRKVVSGMSVAAFDFDDDHTHHNAELALDEEKVACRARGREPR